MRMIGKQLDSLNEARPFAPDVDKTLGLHLAGYDQVGDCFIFAIRRIRKNKSLGLGAGRDGRLGQHWPARVKTAVDVEGADASGARRMGRRIRLATGPRCAMVLAEALCR